MRHLIAFPILALAVIIQSAIVSRITLLSGFADLLLVMVAAWSLQKGVTTAWHWAVLAGILTAIVSGLPWWVPMTGFLVTVFLAKSLEKRIWQAPLIAMFTVTFLGSLFLYALSFLVLLVQGAVLTVSEAFGLVILPGVLLNLLISIPVFWLMRDLARWAYYPMEEED